MDRPIGLAVGEPDLAVARLRDYLVASIEAAPAFDTPFYHLVLDCIFPEDAYAAMLANMPTAADYRPMHGRSKVLDLADGTHTRVKIDLFPEYVRHLPPEKRAVWDAVGRALCAPAVRAAFVRRLAPALQRRFGRHYDRVGMFPTPVLTRDIHGYLIAPHTDTKWKGITVQLYLPRDRSIAHVGTIFHEQLAEANGLRAQHRLCVRGRNRHVAFGRCGRSRGNDAGQHSPDLFRRCRPAALSAQPRQAVR
jgi:hypothetical protein